MYNLHRAFKFNLIRFNTGSREDDANYQGGCGWGRGEPQLLSQNVEKDTELEGLSVAEN